MLNINEILELEGVIIRKIPKKTISIFNERHYKGKEHQELFYDHKRKCNMCREVRLNSLGGKYIITVKSDQYNQVHFNYKRDGIGDTIESAWEDYLKKENN